MVAATMAQPGVVLRRPAGSNGRFAEHSDLPTSEEVEHPHTSRSKAKKSTGPQISEKAASRAAVDFERERKQRDAARRRELAEDARSASVAIERSPRRRLHSIKPSANMMSEQATSKRSATPSGKGLKTRRLVGRERRGS